MDAGRVVDRMTAIPIGWGFRPGRFINAGDGLQTLPDFQDLLPHEIARAITAELIECPGILASLKTPLELCARWPKLHKARAYEIVANAAKGRLPRVWAGRKAA